MTGQAGAQTGKQIVDWYKLDRMLGKEVSSTQFGVAFDRCGSFSLALEHITDLLVQVEHTTRRTRSGGDLLQTDTDRFFD